MHPFHFVADLNIYFSMMPFLPHVPAGGLGVKCGILTPCPHRHSGGRSSGEWMSLFMAASWVPGGFCFASLIVRKLICPWRITWGVATAIIHDGTWQPQVFICFWGQNTKTNKKIFLPPSFSPWLAGTWSHFPTSWTAALFILYFGSVGLF